MNENRRKLLITSLKGGLGLAAFSLFAPSLLSGCKKKKDHSSLDAKEVEVNVNSCSKASSLSESDKAIRASLKYVDNSPQSSQTCDNCKLYTLPQGNEDCGGCKVVPGPIHPKGYCTAWLHRM